MIDDNIIKNTTIGFSHEPIIGVLYVNELKPKFVREKFNEKSIVYSRINEMVKHGFGYSYINNILAIEDDAVKRAIFDCMLEELDLSTQGDFIAFFHAERKNNVWLASGLTLPDMYYLKNHLIAGNLNIII